MRFRRKLGFSLIELFIVLVVIGILVGLAVPRFREFKHRYYITTMVSDLRNLAATEEGYWSAADAYTSDVTALKYNSSPDVTITFVEVTPSGWSAYATHANDASKCAVYYGSAAILAPATVKTIIGCN